MALGDILYDSSLGQGTYGGAMDFFIVEFPVVSYSGTLADILEDWLFIAEYPKVLTTFDILQDKFEIEELKLTGGGGKEISYIF